MSLLLCRSKSFGFFSYYIIAHPLISRSSLKPPLSAPVQVDSLYKKKGGRISSVFIKLYLMTFLYLACARREMA